MLTFLVGLLAGASAMFAVLALCRTGGDADAAQDAALLIQRLRDENDHLRRALRRSRALLVDAQDVLVATRIGMAATDGSEVA